MNRWIVIGIVFQVAMVAVGHAVPALRDWWGPGGMLISLVVGCLVARTVTGWSQVVRAGALAGGVGAFIGIALAWLLHDVPPLLLLLGTVASTVAGIIGAAVVYAFAKKSPQAS